MFTRRKIPLTIWTFPEDLSRASFAAQFAPKMFDQQEEELEVRFMTYFHYFNVLRLFSNFIPFRFCILSLNWTWWQLVHSQWEQWRIGDLSYSIVTLYYNRVKSMVGSLHHLKTFFACCSNQRSTESALSHFFIQIQWR